MTFVEAIAKEVKVGLDGADYADDDRRHVLAVDSEGPPALLHNESPDPGHWLSVRLRGFKSNRDGLGALLTAKLADGRTLLRHCQTDGSYLSASDRRVHFGLGPAASIESLTIRWPSGKVDVHRNLAVDRVLDLREGDTGGMTRG